MSKKRRNTRPGKAARPKKRDLEQLVISFLKANPDKQYNYKQIAAAIDIHKKQERNQLLNVIDKMEREERILASSRKRYRINTRGLMLEGRFERRRNGKNFFVPDDDSNIVFVAERNSLHAMNGDRVRIQLLAKRQHADTEGAVVEILERVTSRFVGEMQIKKHFAFLILDSKFLANDIFIPLDYLNGAKNGDKVVVEIMEWPQRANNPIGKVIDVLGRAGDNTAEMHAILAEYNLPYKYPEEVEKYAEKLNAGITPDEIKKREDYRDITTITIDPDTAKDYDDALSVRRLDSGLWEVGIHIADVTHYVQPGDLVDEEAGHRANSIYLVDRTIPMLPEKLSNELCSLRPNEDKLCYSVIFEMDDNAYVKHSRIVKTVVRSDARLTYEQAQQVIEEGQGDYADQILPLDKLARQLRERRFSYGAINFDRYEVKFNLDEKGKPLGVYFEESKESNHLIEEFMLLTNRTVAEKIGKVKKGKQAKAFVYRIHDNPDPDKLEVLNQFIRRFGHKIKTEGSNQTVAKSLNKLLDNVQGRPEENLIETITIRTMSKAIYSTDNMGHYGLAFDYYTHFTSPIRRYSDMMVHRLVQHYLEGGASVNVDHLEDDCKHCSAMELLSANAERDSIKYKQVEFMSDKVGKVFDGVVSGVTEWGIYVEINENKCEGLIPIRDLDDDFYELDEKNYRLIGRRTRNEYRLGQSVSIKVAQANLERRQLDYILA